MSVYATFRHTLVILVTAITVLSDNDINPKGPECQPEAYNFVQVGASSARVRANSNAVSNDNANSAEKKLLNSMPSDTLVAAGPSNSSSSLEQNISIRSGVAVNSTHQAEAAVAKLPLDAFVSLAEVAAAVGEHSQDKTATDLRGAAASPISEHMPEPEPVAQDATDSHRSAMSSISERMPEPDPKAFLKSMESVVMATAHGFRQLGLSSSGPEKTGVAVLVYAVAAIGLLSILIWMVWHVWHPPDHLPLDERYERRSAARQTFSLAWWKSMLPFARGTSPTAMRNDSLTLLSAPTAAINQSSRADDDEPLSKELVVQHADGLKLGVMGGIQHSKQNCVIDVHACDQTWKIGNLFVQCKFAELGNNPHCVISSYGCPIAYVDLSLISSPWAKERKVTVCRAAGGDSWGLWDPENRVPCAVAAISSPLCVTLRRISKHGLVGSVLLSCLAEEGGAARVQDAKGNTIAKVSVPAQVVTVKGTEFKFTTDQTGLVINAISGKVASVQRGSQGEKLGVQVGWFIDKVNGYAYAPKLLNLDTNSTWVNRHPPCSVIFKKDAGNAEAVVDQEERPSIFVEMSQGADTAMVLCAVLSAAKLS